MPVEMMPLPASGRVFHSERTARMGDIGVANSDADMTPVERLRTDAVGRYLQDLAADDSADSGLPDPNNWVVKWYVVEVAAHCAFNQRLAMDTWASGHGGRWAERRSRLIAADTDQTVVEAAGLWVRVDGETGRPKKLNDEFHEIYGEASAGRKPPTKLSQPTKVPADAATVLWHPRSSDMDILGHVNNAAYFHIVEQTIASWPSTALRVALEYRTPIEGFDPVQLHTAEAAELPGALDLWVTSADTLHLTAQVTPLAAVLDYE